MTRQIWSDDGVAALFQQGYNLVPTPRSMTTAMNQYECTHGCSPFFASALCSSPSPRSLSAFITVKTLRRHYARPSDLSPWSQPKRHEEMKLGIRSRPSRSRMHNKILDSGSR